MKYRAGYLQHGNQHDESLRLYDSICRIRERKLAASKELYVTDQINHGIAMIKAYKFRRDLPDSPRMAVPSTRLLNEAVRHTHLCMNFWPNFLTFVKDEAFKKLLSSDYLSAKQRIRCLSEQARALVLLGRNQVLNSVLRLCRVIVGAHSYFTGGM